MSEPKEIDLIRQLQEDYKKVFLGTPEGKRILADLLAFTGVFELSFDMSEYDAHRTAFNEGRRSLGLKLLEALDQNSYAGLLELQKAGAIDSQHATER